MKEADKKEVIAAITDIVNTAPEETQRVQLILLGHGGWISTSTWNLVEEDE